MNELYYEDRTYWQTYFVITFLDITPSDLWNILQNLFKYIIEWVNVGSFETLMRLKHIVNWNWSYTIFSFLYQSNSSRISFRLEVCTNSINAGTTFILINTTNSLFILAWVYFPQFPISVTESTFTCQITFTTKSLETYQSFNNCIYEWTVKYVTHEEIKLKFQT